MKWHFYRITKKECCPYCRKRCISFNKIYKAGSVWHFPECPECGATLQLEKRLVTLKNLVIVVAIVIFLVITYNADVILPVFWALIPLAVDSILKILIALISDLDYEEFWNYPKPKNKNTP